MSSSHNIPLNWDQKDDLAVNTIRVLAAEMVQKANSGHPGMPMGFAKPAHLLWTRFLKFNPDNPFWPARDRFILSCGHGSALMYSLLHLAGYDLTIDDIKQFRQWEAKTAGHPEFGLAPGVETTTGPLGQGVGNGIGMAMAQRYILNQLDSGDYNPLDHYIYVVASDGDLQEGVSAEASSLAGRQDTGNVIVLYDDNRISIEGSTDLSWREDVAKRYEAYGWHVLKVDGDDEEAIYNAITKAQNDSRPSLIAVRTHIGFGSPSKQDSESSHGAPLGEEELKATKEKLGWTYEPFTVPEEAYGIYTDAADRGRAAHEEWLKILEDKLASDKNFESVWEELVHGKLPDDLFDTMPDFEVGSKIATRGASGMALNHFAAKYRALIGGSADLAGSNKTDIKGAADFLPENKDGRIIHFGIREHGMGAILNGMILYANLRPYGGTFLIFSDYMRGSMRLAGLMNLPVLYVLSHDSIGVGEDGPTHQPIEHYAALRIIPNMHVYRPGDANEMAYAWKMALQRTEGPTSILSTRQGLPVLDRDKYASAENVEKGGYVLADCDGTPDVVIIATGSEVSLAIEAYEALEGKKKIRVVSIPCWEVFEAQGQDYIDEVIPPSVTKRLGIEVGVSYGWERWIGCEGKMICRNDFGASAPGAVVFDKFGFNLDNVLKTIDSL